MERTEEFRPSKNVSDSAIVGFQQPEPDAGDWDFDVHNRPSTSTARAPGLARTHEDAGAAGTGTSTPVTTAALKELQGAEELKFDIDWSLTNDEFDAWMEGDTSDEVDEGGSDQQSACNLFYPFKQDKFGGPGQGE